MNTLKKILVCGLILSFSFISFGSIKVTGADNALQRKIERLERRIQELESDMARVERKLRHNNQHGNHTDNGLDQKWTCSISAFSDYFSDTQATKGEATAGVIKKCTPQYMASTCSAKVKCLN